jgi:hypothetical protein
MYPRIRDPTHVVAAEEVQFAILAAYLATLCACFNPVDGAFHHQETLRMAFQMQSAYRRT